jgi:hypothetical protein
MQTPDEFVNTLLNDNIISFSEILKTYREQQEHKETIDNDRYYSRYQKDDSSQDDLSIREQNDFLCDSTNIEYGGEVSKFSQPLLEEPLESLIETPSEKEIYKEVKDEEFLKLFLFHKD